MASPLDKDKGEERSGLVLRLEKLSIHDGQGLRTVVFLKGCPLHCRWCSTPESLKTHPERGYKAARCGACGLCVEQCPEKALSLSDSRVVTDGKLCKACFACAAACPNDAVIRFGKKMTVGRLVEEICKDEVFYFHSGGGVTISGGEGLLQPDYVAAVLLECRLRGIDTALETSLYAPWEDVEKTLPHTAAFYIDLKHADYNKHKDAVGAGNRLILDNLTRLDASPFAFTISIRLPLIPGFNDSDSDLCSVLKIASSLKKASEIELLPYHRLGIGTYEQLGRTYDLSHVPVPTREHIIDRAAFLKKQQPSIPIKAGGGYSC